MSNKGNLIVRLESRRHTSTKSFYHLLTFWRKNGENEQKVNHTRTSVSYSSNWILLCNIYFLFFYKNHIMKNIPISGRFHLKSIKDKHLELAFYGAIRKHSDYLLLIWFGCKSTNANLNFNIFSNWLTVNSTKIFQ